MTHRFIPRLSPEEIARQQLEGLRFTVRQAFKSPQYRKRLEACGVTPDDITSLDDLRRLPTVDVEDLREGYPLPLLCVPEEEVVRIHASSGTTGKRKILAYTANDVNNFTLQMARCYEMAGLTPLDRMQVAVGYGLWTAGAGFQLLALVELLPCPEGRVVGFNAFQDVADAGLRQQGKRASEKQKDKI